MMEASKLARLQYEQQLAVSETEEKIAQWEKFKFDYEALHKRLRTLPDKVTHDVMVPFGSVGLMPGKLIHTNEVLVLLGDNWFVERSAKQAAEIVTRRIKSIDKTLKELNDQKQLLTPRQVFTQELQHIAQGGDVKEIREDYDSDTERKWREEHKRNVRSYREKMRKSQGQRSEVKPKAVPDDDALWKRLDELEKQETEKSELSSVDDGDENEEEMNEAEGRQFTSTEKDHSEKRVVWADESSKPEDGTESDDDLSEDSSDGASDTEDEQVRKQISCITFSHTQKASSTESSASGSDSGRTVPTIQSPSDIYKQFAQPTAPKSILKTKKNKHKVEEERRIATEEREKVKQPIDIKRAFTGTVLEKPLVSDMISAPPVSAPSSRPVSKFRAMRSQNQGGKKF